MPTQRLKRLGQVFFADASLLWLTLAGLLAAWLVPAFFSCEAATRSRYSGLALQLFGILLVAKGIGDTRHLFGQPTLGARAKKWMQSLGVAVWPPTPISGRMAITLGGMLTASGGATGTLRSKPETLEERIGALESDLASFRAQLAATTTELSNRVTATERLLDEERPSLARFGVEAFELPPSNQDG